MLSVSDEIKAKFKSDYCKKEMKITVGSTVITNSGIYKDGFKLTESVMDGTVEFVGCIASTLEFKVSTSALPKGNYNGMAVRAEVAIYYDDNTLSDYISLFRGQVDSCEKSADGHYQEFVCYDKLAYLGDAPGYNAYKAAFGGSSIPLFNFRNYICSAAGLTPVTRSLANDAIIFKKRKRIKDVTLMALLRHICQIEGAFGIINRSGMFDMRYIDDQADPESIPYYRSLEYSDHVIEPIGDSVAGGSVTIRTNSQDAGVTVDWTNYQQYAGTDPGWSDESQDDYLVDEDDDDVVANSYIIEGNLIAYKLKKSKKQVIGANIMAALGHDSVFRDYTVKCNGLPYVECCDKVLFTTGSGATKEFVVTKRVLEGIQAMKDTYTCSLTQGAGESYVSNVDSTTKGVGTTPTDSLGLSEKNITQNGTYSANDDGAEGYSQVTVNVSGGGGQNKYGYYLKWDVKANLPGSSRGCACVLKNDRLHLIFGTNYYYSDDDGDTWTAGTSLPHGFLNAAACVVFNDKIFCFGGTGSSYYQTVLIGDDNGGQSAMSWTSVQTGVNCTRYQSSSPYAYGGIACVYNNRIHIVALGFHYESSADGQSYYYRDTVTYNGVTYNTDLGRLVVYNNELHILGGYDGTRNHHFIYQNGNWVAQADLPCVVYNSAACVFDDILMVGKSPVVPTTDANSQFIAGVAAWIEEDNYFKQETLPFYTLVYGSSTRMYEAPYPGNLIVKDGKLHFIGEPSLNGATYNTHTVATKENLPTPAA